MVGLGKGLFDWLVQRITALLVFFYLVVLVGFWWVHPGAGHSVWQPFLQQRVMQLFGTLAWFALVWHAWLGIWTVATDYISHLWLRQFFLGGVLAALLACFVMAMSTLWSLM
jgi:succinate dehydrogenase / fumarate reductase, membrane anchor subunit